MTATTDFDRLVSSWLETSGPPDVDASTVESAIAAARRQGQRRGVVAALVGPEPWPRTPARWSRAGLRSSGSPRWLMLVLLGLIALALIATAAVIGSRTLIPNLLAIDGPAPPSPAALPGPALVYGGSTGGLFVAEADGSLARLLVRGGRYIQPRLSADRRWIAAEAYMSPGRSLVVLRADGAVALDLRGDNPVGDYSWGAVGASAHWLAASIDQSIVVVDPVSGTRVTIDSGDATAGVVGALAWSPDAPVLWWATGRQPPFGLTRAIAAADVHSIRLDAADGTLRIADSRSFEVPLDTRRGARGLEQMAVSPDGRTLAFRARLEHWLRSDVLLLDAEGGAPTYLTSAPPDAPWVSAWSGIRWLPDGSALVAEVGHRAEQDVDRPMILPVDGSSPREINVTDLDGGVVDSTGPVLSSDKALLVGGPGTWLDVGDGRQPRVHDLWVADAYGRGAHRVASNTIGGDLR